MRARAAFLAGGPRRRADHTGFSRVRRRAPSSAGPISRRAPDRRGQMRLHPGCDAHARLRAVPTGCGPTVGIAGLTLGGGLGLLGRLHGLTCDALLSAQVVLASGRVVDCDLDREPELFWALRGAGGGQFGVVTSLVFATV